MKYCRYCGAQLVDEAVVCVACGRAVAPAANTANSDTANSSSSTIKTIAKIFMVLGCVASAFAFLIPLCWTIPMTVKYWHDVDNNRPTSVGFKVCALLFVNVIAGILMLCDGENNL